MRISRKGDLIRKHQGGGNVLSINAETKCTVWGAKMIRGNEIEFPDTRRTKNQRISNLSYQKSDGRIGMAVSNKGDRVGISLGISRLVLIAVIRIDLRINVLFSSRNQEMDQYQHPLTKKGEKGKKCRKGENGKGKSVKYTFLESRENGIGRDAIPESRVNVSARQVLGNI